MCNASNFSIWKAIPSIGNKMIFVWINLSKTFRVGLFSSIWLFVIRFEVSDFRPFNLYMSISIWLSSICSLPYDQEKGFVWYEKHIDIPIL